MKLVNYTVRNLIVPMLIVFTVWGCVFCLLLLNEVKDETDNTLLNYKEFIIQSTVSDSTFPNENIDILTSYHIREVPAEEADLDMVEFYDSSVYVEFDEEQAPVRALRTYFRTKDNRYHELVIEISTLGQDEMITTSIWGMIVLYILMIGCIMAVMQRGFKKCFRPLYNLLDWLKNFNVGKTNTPLDNPTGIDEFKILNEAAQESADRSINLYNRQKEFVGNAAHELQTPLAICMNKLELLNENPDCTEDLLQEMAGLHRTLSGIIRLNKSLLLLSRIENRQFPDAREICFNRLVSSMTDELNDIYENKNLQVRIDGQATLIHSMNESLAATLTINFLKNAYIHNVNGGRIEITIRSKQLTIANTGSDNPLDINRLFARFARQSDHKESTGLGLAIAKSIAALYSIRIDYNYEDGMHIFVLIFP